MRKFETNIPRKGISRPQFQFPYSCVCERFIYSHDRSAYSAAGKYVNRSWEYINSSQTHECGEIGAAAAQFPEKEYTNGIFVAVYFSQASIPISPPFVLLPHSISPLWDSPAGGEEWRGTNLSVRTRRSVPSQQELNTVLEFLNNLWELGTE